MKNIFFTTVFVFAFILQSQLYAQRFDQLDKDPTDISYLHNKKASQPLVKVVYGRPQKHNDIVFGHEVPYGEIWKTGANEATEVKFYHNMKFGNKLVQAGTYVMHTIPGEKEWTIILNSNTDTWGAYFYDESKDVLRIKVPVQTAKEIDVFSIAFMNDFKNTFMVLAWDTTRVNIPLETNNELIAKI